MTSVNGMIVGTAAEIKAVEKSMRRAWRTDKSAIWPSHSDAPRFTPWKIYGIALEPGDRHTTYYVVNADTILRDMLSFA